MKAKLRRAGLWLACLLLACVLLPVSAQARTAIDVTRDDCTLTITYPCPGVEFRLYRVAEVSRTGTFTLTGDFRDLPVQLNGLDKIGWRQAANTLDGYVDQRKLEPADRASIGSDNKLTFSNKTPGVYLVTWDQHTAADGTYIPQPFLICLPDLALDDSWDYAVEAVPKYEHIPGGGPDGPDTPIKRRVRKVWRDGGAQDRPERIVVQLLRDGEVWQEVTLSAENGWEYEWPELDAKYSWKIVEKEVPDGYTVTTDRDGNTFLVTNTWTPPDVPDVPDTPDTPDTPDEPKIPQTGQLWWPVPLLALGGMGLFLAGWLRRRTWGGNDEA